MSIVDKRPWKLFGKRLHHAYILISKSLVLSYLLISFALILYVPYLVPIALVVAAYIIGYILNKSKTFNKNDWFNIAVPFIGAIVLAAGIGGIFIATHYSEIHTITNTSYPGKRDVLSGGSNVRDLLVTYLQPRLQAVGRGDHYIINQSESSSFILLPLFFILPAIGIIIWLYIKKRRIEWMLVCLVVVSALFAIHLFVPGVNMISKIFLLNLVPQLRLLVGLGLLGLILSTYTVLVIKSEFKLTKNFIIIAFMYTIFYLILIIAAGIEVSLDYPAFISSKKLIFALAITSTAGLFFLLVGKLRLGLGVLAIFSIASIVNIHPLYVGLGPIYESEVTSKIDLLSDSTSSWAVANDIYLENIPQMSDRKAITGVNPYPSLNFWKKYSTNEEIYNRYAHIFLTSNDAAPLILVQSDLFAVSLSCSRPINNTINYILSTTPLVGSCNKLIDKIVYPAKTFYFYSVNPISRNQ